MGSDLSSVLRKLGASASVAPTALPMPATALLRAAFIGFGLLALVGPWAAAAAQAGPPAGIAAYACREGSALHLLAFDPAPGRQAWGHLGGQAEAGETPARTALREFHEESNCAFGDLSGVQADLVGPSVAPGRSGFHTYGLRLPFVPAAQIAQPRRCADVERNQWVWVDHDELQQALDSPQVVLKTADGEPSQVVLWNAARLALLQARRDGVLPVRDPCR